MRWVSLAGGFVVSCPLLIGACSSSGSDGPIPPKISSSGASQPQSGYVGEDQRVDRATLQFSDAKAAKTYDTLYACLVRDEPSFFAYPLRKIGNFVNVEWCRGKGAHINCSGGDTRKVPGAAWSELEVLHYDRDWPLVFGLSFSVGDIPEQGIGASFSWAEGGRGILGDHMGLVFHEAAAGKIQATLWIGMSDEFTVGETVITTRAQGTRASLYGRLRFSPGSLATEIRKRLDDLESAVKEALDADTPRKCVYGKYKNDGIPPACIEKVPLDASEKEQARERLRQYVSDGRAFVGRNEQAMYEKFLEILPERCWSP